MTFVPDVAGNAQAFNWQSGGDARGLDLTDQPSALTTQQTPAVLLTMREGAPGGGKGPLLVEEESLTLATGNGQTLFQPQAFQQNQRDEVRLMGDQAGALAANAGVHQQNYLAIPQAFRKAARAQSVEDDESWVADGQANTLNTFDMGDTRTTHAIVEQVGTLQSRTHKGLNHENVRDGQAVFNSYGVRRLTPVECERLQAFPDGWTEPAVSDSARYKALGNAVTVNTVRWVLGRMVEQS
jgi:site-specific DNA-cytosine methylase